MTAVLVDTPFDSEFRYDAEEWPGRSITDLRELTSVLCELEAGWVARPSDRVEGR